MSVNTLVLAAPAIRDVITANLRLIQPSRADGAVGAVTAPTLETTPDLLRAVFGGTGCTEDTMLYAWGAYDHVVLQDSWPSIIPQRPSDPLGLELAYLDYYERGNFNTRKTIVVIAPTDISSHFFDPKNAFQFHPKECVQRVADDVDGTRLAALAGQSVLMHGVFAEALRSYIYSQAVVLVIEDEAAHMRETLRLLGRPAVPDITGVTLAIVDGSKVLQVPAADYDQLTAYLAAAIRRIEPPRFAIVVTDILFTDPSWTRSGIDVIANARGEFGSGIGIAAWTGFATPFINTAAYQRGADVVAQKGSSDGHTPGRAHGSWSLLLALGHLCYQKDLLRQIRTLCLDREGLTTPVAAQQLERLRGLLPDHAVSMHLREEWRDTNYLLHALATYQPRGVHAEAARRMTREKYAR